MFLRFRKWLKDFADLIKPDLIAYEQAHFRGGAATEICVGLQTRAQEIAAERGIESAPVKTNVLKKWATGKGNAGKGEMMTAAGKHLGRPPMDDNEADAVLVGMWAVDEFV
jgi:Holliday junction resolvasome RuvABC endonuclease subunit